MGIEIRRRPEGALLRTYLSAAGIGPEGMSKPLVGVVTNSTQVFSERPDARELGEAATSGIEAAGGVAIRWDSVRSPEQMAWGHAEGYSFAWRDQLADLIESWTQQQALDGLVLVGDSSETLVGMAMAAARLNLPALMVTTGPKRWEYSEMALEEGLKKKKPSDPYELMSRVLFPSKKAAFNGLNGDKFNECLLAQDNHSQNAVDLIVEGLGLCLPGMSTAAPKSARRHELAFTSGQRILGLIKTGYTFKRALSSNSFLNAVHLNAALGGSVDIAVHLMALAHEVDVKLPLEIFDKAARETPQVCRLGGVGEKEPHRIEDLDKAGGVWAVFHAIMNHVHPTTTLSGKGALELAKTTQVKDNRVILSRKPYSKQSGVGVLYGNLAQNGATYLLNQAIPELSKLKGPVEVFESEQDGARALTSGKIKKGSILVVRNQGPKGGPGLRILRLLPALMESNGWNKSFPLITDGRLPDTPKGMFISLVSPESFNKGTLAVLKTGDIVEIDVTARQLWVRLTDTDLQVRLARWQTPESKFRRGFIDRYSRSVSEVHEGAILK